MALSDLLHLIFSDLMPQTISGLQLSEPAGRVMQIETMQKSYFFCIVNISE